MTILLVSVLYFINVGIFIALGSKSKTHSALFFVACVSYYILRKGSEQAKKTSSSFSKSELKWIAAYMQRGYEKHNVTPKREIANFMRLPSQATLDYAAEFEPRAYDIANKAIGAMGRTEKLSKTTDLETPASQIESISPDAVRANSDGRGVTTEPSAKPPEIATETSANIRGKEIYGRTQTEATILTIVGILFGIILLGILAASVTNSNAPNRDTGFTWEEAASNPNIREPHYNSGIEYEKKVQHPNSDEDYYTARDPQNELAHTKRGNDFLKTGKYAGAIDAYNTALRINPSSVAVYYNRSVAYAKTGQYEKAITDCSKVIELDPNMANAYYNRGFSYWYLGHKQLSVKDLILAARFGNMKAQEFLNSRGIKW